MVFVLGTGIILTLLNMAGKIFFCMHKLFISVGVLTMQGKAIFSSLTLIPSQPVDFLFSIFEIAIPTSSTNNGGIENVLF